MEKNNLANENSKLNSDNQVKKNKYEDLFRDYENLKYRQESDYKNLNSSLQKLRETKEQEKKDISKTLVDLERENKTKEEKIDYL